MLTSSDIRHLTLESERLSQWTQAANTRAAYARDWKLFVAWCGETAYPPLPATPGAVVLYVTSVLATHKITTARRYISAINDAHRAAGYPRPADRELRQLLEGAERLRCERPRQMQPITVEQLREALRRLQPDPKGVRNRAILTLGFGTALRRSTLCGLDLADVAIVEQGVLIAVRKEKQDQKGRGRILAVARGTNPETCPLRALEAWLALRGAAAPGPLFTRIVAGKPTLLRLYNDKVNRIVKAAVKSLGLDPRKYGAHTLRASFVTAAFAAGCGEILIARHTGHRSLSSLRRYFRPSDPWAAKPSARIGL